MESEQIRWVQRLVNYSKALSQLAKAVRLSKLRALTELEEQGLIKAFEFTHELAWNLLKDYLAYQGTNEIRGSRDAFRAAFQADLITDGHVWMETIQSRNRTYHTYNEVVAGEIATAVVARYFDIFKALENTMINLRNNLQNDLFS